MYFHYPEAMEIQASELKARLDAGEALTLLDCREDFENAHCRIEPSVLIPMKTIPAALQRIEAMADEKPLVVYCHHGVRSLNVTAWLRRQGVENVVSLSGGIDRWSMEIDPSVPRY
jgi:rhodanese-related sulfurtransferase